MYTKIKQKLSKQEKATLKDAEKGMLMAINNIEQLAGEAVMIRYEYEALARLCDREIPEIDNLNIKVFMGDYIDRQNDRYSENLKATIKQNDEVYRQFRKIVNTIYEDIDDLEAWTA